MRYSYRSRKLWTAFVTGTPQSEDSIQTEVVNYLTLALPMESFFFAVSNEAASKIISIMDAMHKNEPNSISYPAYRKIKNSAVAAIAKFKGMGLTAGVSDLVVCYKGRSIFIEMKSTTGRQSPVQKDFQDACKIAGFPYYICRNRQDVEDCLTKEQIKLKKVGNA
jgi:hypothetical protein